MTNRLTALISGAIVYLLCVADGHAGPINWPLDQPSGGSPWTVVSGSIAWYSSAWGALTGGSGNDPHTNLLFRSPEFQLDGSGDLTVQLKGGRGQGSSSGVGSAPTNESQIVLGGDSADDGIQGFSLRRVSSGDYVFFGERSYTGNDLETVSLTQAQLTPYANDGNFYTIDFYDTFHGGWGHTEITNVTVPGATGVIPEPSTLVLSTLLGVAGIGVAGWQRRRKQKVS